MSKRQKPSLADRTRRVLAWIRLNVPPGVRSILGLLLVIGGFFGFLPILGFWMIPLGLAVIALDFPGIRRWWRNRSKGR